VKNGTNGVKNTGSSNNASTRANSTGSINNSGGRIESHNVGWSFTVLNTMASIPSRQGVEAIFSPKTPTSGTATPRLFQVEVVRAAPLRSADNAVDQHPAADLTAVDLR
jgi:hypothetical protein